MGEIGIELLRDLFARGRFTISSHGIPHRLKEGFSVWDIAEAVKAGRIIERYPERQRCLVWGTVRVEDGSVLDLHVVCHISNGEWVNVVTAYIPDPSEWESPPLRRRE